MSSGCLEMVMAIDSKIVNRLENNDPKTKNLDLSACDLKDEDIRVLTAACAKNTQLITLNLGYNSITSKGVASLNTLAHIRSLNLEGNQIGDLGALALSENRFLDMLNRALQHLQTVK
jgi:Leucine-rich repeat (LRR) protein